jgi:mannose/cellobiose epimerase-like protein (N-acyl-D-glucosamine 2-epimerase family)
VVNRMNRREIIHTYADFFHDLHSEQGQLALAVCRIHVIATAGWLAHTLGVLYGALRAQGEIRVRRIWWPDCFWYAAALVASSVYGISWEDIVVDIPAEIGV